MDRRPDRSPAEGSQAAVALFAALLAPAIAGIGFICRCGFAGNSPLEWCKYVGLSWFLVTFASLARWTRGLDRDSKSCSWWITDSSLTLAALLFAIVCGVETSFVARGAAAVICLVGAAGFLLVLRCTVLKRSAFGGTASPTAHDLGRRRSSFVVPGVCAIAFALFGAGAAWGSGYQNPLFVEGMCFGTAQIDTLFHATISNMIRTYGVPSTGLDGLPFLPYHFGSHWIFARLCNLLDVRVIDFYNRGYPIIFVPFGVFSLGSLALALNRRGDEAKSPSKSIGVACWLVLLAGYIGFLPYAAGVLPSVAWNSIIVSESYAVGVAVSLLTIASAVSFFRKRLTSPNSRLLAEFAGVTVFAVLLGAIGLLKISLMLVLAAAGIYFFFRLALYRRAVFNGLFLAGALAAYAAFRLSSNPGYGTLSGFVPFGFLRSYVDPQWWPYFWLAYYAWFWIASALRLRQEAVRTPRELAAAVRRRRLLDLEFLIVAAVVGAAPGLFLTNYSSTHYFSDYQHWLALALVLSIVMGGRSNVAALCENNPEPVTESPPNRWTAGRVFAAALVLSLCGTMAANTIVLLAGVTAANLAARGHASGQTGLGRALMRGHFGNAAAILRGMAAEVETRENSDKGVLALLRSLDEMPIEEKRKSLLFIPKSNRQFWDLLHGAYSPKDAPLVAPALSGIAMIDGLYVPQEGDTWLEYGYQSYPRASAHSAGPSLERRVQALRNRCAEMGFRTLFVLEQTRSGAPELRKLDCP